jgi:hypothetical protein
VSVLSQARSALYAIATGAKNRVATAGKVSGDIDGAIGSINSAETKTRSLASAMQKVHADSTSAVGSLQAIISQTQLADRHRAVPQAQAAAEKAKKAVEALAGLEAKYKELRDAMKAAQNRVDEAKMASAAAASAIQKTAATL